jgi:hypothetical protein
MTELAGKLRLVVPKEAAGLRLDRFLAAVGARLVPLAGSPLDRRRARHP